MCGIAGVLNLAGERTPRLDRKLRIMNDLIHHRGPDGEGFWQHPRGHVGLAHCRLSIIDLDTGAQPMTDGQGNWLVFNGEIYNYLELREQLGPENFNTRSDTEVILQAYRKWGEGAVEHLRGMFAFALWDEKRQILVCARDRFAIKPFYYTQVGDQLYFASEVKALVPFLPEIETDLEGLTDYLVFQFCLHGKTLFKNVRELPPGHLLRGARGATQVRRYWQVYYHLDFDHTEKYFGDKLCQLLMDSVDVHKRSDVPIGGYISGGLDSSIVASLATRAGAGSFLGFTGKFAIGAKYDESHYARALADWRGFPLREIDITVQDFLDNMRKIIYHLDYPVAGPGSFPQFMVSRLSSKERNVVLGGKGGDEILGGYVRYLIAYFERCIQAAIDGTMHNGRFIVTYESIIPNLVALRGYQPLLQEFWAQGLFDSLDRRYFRLINRAPTLDREIRWDLLAGYNVFDSFRSVFQAENVGKESYFDSMTHFDFKTLLPALLHVEDRVSMAHGLESRVPFLDHPVVEFTATMPSNVKFKEGCLKHILRNTMQSYLPSAILERKDKMGFPVPLSEWLRGEAKDFVWDVLSSKAALNRDVIDNRVVLQGLEKEPQFGRKLWGLLSLEIWQQEFHDKASSFRSLLGQDVPGVRAA